MKYNFAESEKKILFRNGNKLFVISVVECNGKILFSLELRTTYHYVSFTIYSNHVGQLVSGLCTFKLSCRIEIRRIIAGTGQEQLTFRSANATPTFHHHHLHNPAGTYLGRSAAAATRLEYSWTRGDVSWCTARCSSLLFVRISRQPSTMRQYTGN